MRTIKLFLFCAITIWPALTAGQDKTKVILDADTGNEVDDLYAIVRAFVEPGWDIIALNATQWQSSQWAVDQTMEESHRLNQVLVSYLKMKDEVRTLRGGTDRMFDWGDKAQHSAAAYGIIAEAHGMPEGEKLTLIAIGALTNVASALYIDPSIEEKIVVYWLGTTYDFEKGRTKYVDFNTVMDIQAVEFMLSSQVEMHIIPNSVSGKMRFEFAETEKRLRGMHPLGDYLVDRWYRHLDGGRYQRTIWDLGLIGAMIHPEWTEEVKVGTFDNPNIWMYRNIDADAVIEDFYITVADYLTGLSGSLTP